ncbi:MAG: hypothetical protein KDI50_09590, partial [Candidatus Competibacteraceae bacterium]|nr:hypothetical protein [Candidatus Competibacteraceae bacterium]
VLIICRAGCEYRAIVGALGLDTAQPPQGDQKRIIATYSYRDANGNEISQKVRYEPKDFRQRWPDGKGGWLWKKPKDAPAVLYRLPEVLAAKAQGATIYCVEGERDVDQLAALGIVATTNIEGASKPGKRAKWRPDYTAQLAGAAPCGAGAGQRRPRPRPHAAHCAAVAGQSR